ncbi:hypothetical protein FOFC_06717 [Fusarium oxysporum]|nr:hypothetical protein FOFC_21209 [Fusarium oxysporum]KAI8401812.1 hypothetical protein FOFC_18681 [Fusarium oxysporum]KAI8401900.1 hypothetical protein FOFC_17205 [Fusarium oxysporum]KAI8409643.1 hypothetical protein FOFC_09485 [Fusarium oxysporum]KAI8413440.1 hypothetical protein FOFC_06717 [Fusarium oxysporum]
MPLEEVDPNSRGFTEVPPRKRRGRPPKLLKDRRPRGSKPVTRKENSYTKWKIEEVMLWMIHHRVNHHGEIRPPTSIEAQDHFQIPASTIRQWKNKYYDSYVEKRPHIPGSKWPDLEEELYSRFKQRRTRKLIASTSWFRRQARAIFRDLYPGLPDSERFIFSNGWWRGFLRRHSIVKRKITHCASKLPEAYLEVVNSFVRFVRKISIDPYQSRAISMMLNDPKRRFPLHRILNVDETPIPFHYLEGSTWDTLGLKTISGKVDRSGWDKRQATLILYIFADGSLPFPPIIIFHGTPTDEGGRILEKEGHLYAQDVTVEYNEHAYNNESLFGRWIDTTLLKLHQQEEEDLLLVMDAAAFHKTETIKQKLKTYNISTAMIPAGCTCILQPLDVSVNKPFKAWLQEATDLYEERFEAEKGPDYKWSVSDKRVMITHIVSQAVQRLKSDEGVEIDHLISIKGIRNEEIDFTGWEEAIQIDPEDDAEVDRLCDEEQLIDADDDELSLITSYHEMTCVQLRARLQKRGLSTRGNKAELIQRLRGNDDYCTEMSTREQSTIEVYQSVENHEEI